MKITIFFSWQMSTSLKYNRYFIHDCIKRAAKKVKKKPELSQVDFVITEGINGESGSVPVAAKIADERIPNCDIFIADLSVVNNTNKISKIIRNFTGDKYKPNQNNNVMLEYGVAYNAIGHERIIGVLNEFYGSPNENSNNIPFDIRHLRFPISYSYNKRDKSKENVRNQLVNDLATAIRETSLFVLKNRKSKYSPFVTFSEWRNSISLNNQFYRSNKIDSIIDIIKESIGQHDNSMRIIGLSGLGKTRLVFEVFNSLDESEEQIKAKVLYVNCSLYDNVDFIAIVNEIIHDNDHRIVILDNCSKDLHRKVINVNSTSESKLSVISIDSNPEETSTDKINNVNYLELSKSDQGSIVENIINNEFSALSDSNRETIREFAQNIPLMAVLIGESIKNGEKFVGKIDDKELLDKLLGVKGTNERWRIILRSCSIFKYFGYEDGVKSQLKFIAENKNITSLNGDATVVLNEFHEVCQHFLKREIFERKGRFLGIRPFPLAMSLAQEWLEPCTSERLLEVLSNISHLNEPDRTGLSEAIADQMKYLGYNDKAVSIVENIVGAGSPFDNAEVLNSELGSRLFRSFVEVNPVAVLQNFLRNFNGLPKSDLIKIDRGRRNIVWVLEKLCFDKRTFSDASKILFSFAHAENESWANNSTGQLLQLFKIYLPGTESSLNERLKIIKWAHQKENDGYQVLVLGVIKSALNSDGFNRFSGAEIQGARILIDYKPNIDEIYEYWVQLYDMLYQYIKLGTKYSDKASRIFADSIRGAIRFGFGSELVKFSRKIAEERDFDWDYGLENLQLLLKYDDKYISNELKTKIGELSGKLIKTDFKSKYEKLAESHFLNLEDYSSQSIINEINKLAEEFEKDGLSLIEFGESIYTGSQIYTYNFGKKMYEIICKNDSKVNDFINDSLEILLNLEHDRMNATVLVGFITSADSKVKNKFYKKLFNLDNLSCLLFHFLAKDNNGYDYFELLFNLIDSGKCKIQHFQAFRFSESLSNLNNGELKIVAKKILNYNDEGVLVLFDIFYNLNYNNEDKTSEILPILKQCILKIGVPRAKYQVLDEFKWIQTIEKILKSTVDNDFAKFINESIIKSISAKRTYVVDDHSKRIYRVLIEKYFDQIWPVLSKHLIGKDSEYIKFYGLKNIIGSHLGSISNNEGLIVKGNVEKIFSWCSSNPNIAPVRLAELVPIFDNSKEKWHPVTLRLINEYGDNIEVLRHLNSNMGSYSWTGSLVPLLESKKKLFVELMSNYDNNQQVYIWSKNNISLLEKEIKFERNRDEEINL